MFEFELVVRPGRDTERVTTAFYRFLELHSSSRSGSASIQTAIVGEMERRTVQFESEEIRAEFERYLSTFKLAPPPRGLPPRFGFRAPA